MEPQHTITVSGIPRVGGYHPAYYPVLASDGARPAVYTELTGPESAFDVREGAPFDTVRVIRPELVTIQTFQTL